MHLRRELGRPTRRTQELALKAGRLSERPGPRVSASSRYARRRQSARAGVSAARRKREQLASCVWPSSPAPCGPWAKSTKPMRSSGMSSALRAPTGERGRSGMRDSICAAARQPCRRNHRRRIPAGERTPRSLSSKSSANARESRGRDGRLAIAALRQGSYGRAAEEIERAIAFRRPGWTATHTRGTPMCSSPRSSSGPQPLDARHALQTSCSSDGGRTIERSRPRVLAHLAGLEAMQGRFEEARALYGARAGRSTSTWGCACRSSG